MAEVFFGAVVGAVLNELILLAKRAYRCHEECKKLVATLESVEPLLTRVEQSADLGSVTCQVWLKELCTLLVQASDIVGDCVVKKSRLSLKYVPRWSLSAKIQEIHCLIEKKLSSQLGLVILNIVQEIKGDLSPTSRAIHEPPPFEMQDVPPLVVAFDNNPFERLKELILTVPLGASKVIGIKGRGGAGKTLLAKMVHNDETIRRKYGGQCVLWITIGQDVSVSSIYSKVGAFLEHDGSVFERRISKSDLESQRNYLMKALEVKKVLVILDDVWGNTEQDHAMTYWLDIFKGDGSTTLITTRDNDVLNRVRAMERIEVESLSKEESWKLFSLHAFQSNVPPSCEVKDIAMEICNECNGLPLALKVIGGALYNKDDEEVWKYALSRMIKCESWTNLTTVQDELFHCLKYSYDTLHEETKRCFLYFAAFPEDYSIPTDQLYSIWQAEEMFGSCDVEDTVIMGRTNLVTLADRSLINLDGDGRHAKIHDVLQDLAMRIICDGKRGEWAHECHFQPGKVLEELPMIRDTTKRVSFVGTHIRNLEPDVCIGNYQSVEICMLSDMGFGCSRTNPNLALGGLFSGMSHLLYLNLSGCKSLKELPESIKELKSLKHLDLRWCRSLKKLPESIKELKYLSHLNLSWCRSLIELPESIKELKFLTHLNLSECECLEELSECINESKSLVHLKLLGCKSLRELPESIMNFKSHIHLDLSRCASLEELPKSIKGLESLTHLDLSGCESLKKLPESIKELKFLQHLNLSGCESLEKLPEIIKELKSITHLDLSYVWSLELLESIMGLKYLTHLDIKGGGLLSLKALPESIKELKYLTYLDLSHCWFLKELPKSIKEMKFFMHLNLNNCGSLKELPESIKELKALMHLNLRYCLSLEKLPESITDLKSLTHLDLQGCKSLKELPESIKELKSLTHLDLQGCKSLKELPGSIKGLKSLTFLDLRECRFLKEIPMSIKELKFVILDDQCWCWSLEQLPESIKELKFVTHLDLSECESLHELLENIKELKSLTHLDLSTCKSLKELPESIKELKTLTHLNLEWCKCLEKLPESIEALKSLTHLDLCGCNILEELPESIKGLTSLTHLNLGCCESLKELPESIKGLTSLTHLQLRWCESLKELPESIKELKSLTYLDLHGCKILEELPESIKELKSLTHLDLSWCKSLKELPESIKELKSLTHLGLCGCKILEELPESIKGLTSLTYLDVTGCESLKELPESINELDCLLCDERLL